MSAIDQINANGQDYDIMSPEVVSDYVEKIGTICKNPNGYTKGSLFLARDAQDVERMYKTTANISGGQTITVGTNCTPKKLGDLFNDVDTEVGNVKQALSNEVSARSYLGAHNLINLDSPEFYSANGSYAGTSFTNTQTDTRDFVYLKIWYLDSSRSQISEVTLGAITSNGDYSYNLIIPSNTSYVVIGHSGSVRNIDFRVPFSLVGNCKLSLTVESHNPSTVGGMVLKNIMIRLASDTDPTYQPYAKTNTELTKDVTGLLDNVVTLGAKNRFSGTFTSNTVNGVVFTVNSDKSVSANGTVGSTYNYSQFTSTRFILKKGSYILSKNPVLGSSGKRTAVTLYNYTSSTVVSAMSEEEVAFTISADSECELRLICYATGQQYNTVFYPMIRPASDNDNTYAPYAMSNKELTDILSVKIKVYEAETITAGSYRTINDSSLVGKIFAGYAVTGAAAFNLSVLQAFIDSYSGLTIIIKNNGSADVTTGTVRVYYL